MTRRILSLWLPRLATDRIIRRQPAWRNRPLVTMIGQRGRLIVTATNRAAEAVGIFSGMAVADARAIEPGLTVVDADPSDDGRTLERIADWCGRYTPWTAADSPDGVVLDITGCAHLFGGEESLLRDLLHRFRSFGYEALAAIADTPAAAWAVARHGASGRPGDAVVPPATGDFRAIDQVLSDLPVAALRLDAPVVAELRRLGVRRVGDLCRLPRAALADRFGAAVTRRLDQVRGVAAEPISPKRPVPIHLIRHAFADPIVTVEVIGRAVDRLLKDLCDGLVRSGEGVRRLELATYRTDGRVGRIAVGTSRPTRTPTHLMRLLAEKFEDIEPDPGIEVMTLAACVVEPLAALQTPLDMPVAATSHPKADQRADPDIGDLVDRLGSRLGLPEIVRLSPRASWWPERAVEPVAPLAGVAGPSWPADRPRPIRLLDRPEPVEVTAPVPDDPPLLFRWRARVHRIVRADGPERIEPEWWPLAGPSQGTEPRDYYRVEDTEGRRFWLYRQGLYSADRAPRWFLHGFFG